MACSIDHLKKVARGRQAAGMAAHRHAPPHRNQDYQHHQKLVPSQYIYHGPEVITIVQQPDTGSYEVQPTKNYERWYVCQVYQYQAPMAAAGTAAASSNGAAAFYGGVLSED